MRAVGQRPRGSYQPLIRHSYPEIVALTSCSYTGRGSYLAPTTSGGRTLGEPRLPARTNRYAPGTGPVDTRGHGFL